MRTAQIRERLTEEGLGATPSVSRLAVSPYKDACRPPIQSLHDPAYARFVAAVAKVAARAAQSAVQGDDTGVVNTPPSQSEPIYKGTTGEIAPAQAAAQS